MKNGENARVRGTAQGWVSLTIFNAAALDAPEALFESGPPDRRTIKIRHGQVLDDTLLTKLLPHAANVI